MKKLLVGFLLGVILATGFSIAAAQTGFLPLRDQPVKEVEQEWKSVEVEKSKDLLGVETTSVLR